MWYSSMQMLKRFRRQRKADEIVRVGEALKWALLNDQDNDAEIDRLYLKHRRLLGAFKQEN
jgi:hypothetical protein